MCKYVYIIYIIYIHICLFKKLNLPMRISHFPTCKHTKCVQDTSTCKILQVLDLTGLHPVVYQTPSCGSPIFGAKLRYGSSNLQPDSAMTDEKCLKIFENIFDPHINPTTTHPNTLADLEKHANDGHHGQSAICKLC